MNTCIYFIRHAESVYIEGNERERGLTDKGMKDAAAIRELLLGEQIDVFVSSPYRRAVHTIQELADAAGQSILIEEDLRERQLSGADVGKDRFMEAKRKVFEEPDFSFPGGESSREAQNRAGGVVARLLQQYSGKKIGIGTHGDIMTLMMNRYDEKYGYDFWRSTTMPDIYKLKFDRNDMLIEVTRLWK
ncbi:histidine phosphatase family protein [Paenibacillus mesophilus]|uniref:histidine phosphatase family protein n=1 Tax=Paenibacillus mesophilus TaxID=2582849 RepID=UPI00110DA4DE|nr:histidine phosphatase family protein [Paenibacillus mesophilus]TMV50317.1 histidine phosphatase family protein [Paenibacillus mesophilus]